MKDQDSNQKQAQIKSEIIDANQTKHVVSQSNKIPNLKKFKKRINLIKQINKQQLQQVMEAYKPSDQQQVVKKNMKDLNQINSNAKTENAIESQQRKQKEDSQKPEDNHKSEKSVKDIKYLTAIKKQNEINSQIQEENAIIQKYLALENQNTDTLQISDVIGQQNIYKTKDEQLSQKQQSSINSQITSCSNLSLDQSFDNLQKEEQNNGLQQIYQKNDDQIQENPIIHFQEQNSQSFLSESQSQSQSSSNKQDQSKENIIINIQKQINCSNQQLQNADKMQQIKDQIVKGISFYSTLDANEQIENQNQRQSFNQIQFIKNIPFSETTKSEVKTEEKLNVFLFEDIKQNISFTKCSKLNAPENNQLIENDNNKIQITKQRAPSANISQQGQKMKHRKVVCDIVKSNLTHNLNSIDCINLESEKNQQVNQDKDIKAKANQCQSINRKRVLSQQIYNYSELKQQKCNSNQQKYDFINQQKSLTPTSCFQGKQNNQKYIVEGISSLEVNQNLQIKTAKNGDEEKTNILKYNLIIKQKLNSNQQTQKSQIPQTESSKNENNKIQETKYHQMILNESIQKPKQLINSQNQSDINENHQLIQKQPLRKTQNYILNSEIQDNQENIFKKELQIQINNISNTPSSVKDILHNIQTRSNSLSHNQNISRSKKKKLSDCESIHDKQIQISQEQNIKTSTSNNNKKQTNTFTTEKQNFKIRSNTLILNGSPNNNNNNNTNDNLSTLGVRTTENKRTDNINQRRRSNSNIQKYNTLTPIQDQKQNKNLNQRYTNLFNQLNLDWKIQNIKDLIEQCHPGKIMQRSSFMKQQQKKSKQVRFLEDTNLDVS